MNPNAYMAPMGRRMDSQQMEMQSNQYMMRQEFP